MLWQQVLRLYSPYGGGKYFNSVAAHGYKITNIKYQDPKEGPETVFFWILEFAVWDFQ
jgi:hypothetical protein